VCRGCGETFYAPPGHDPLRKHVDYCPGLADEDVDDLDDDEGDEVELPAGHVVAAGPGILPKPIPAAGALVLSGATDPAPDGAVRFALSRLTDDALAELHERAERLVSVAYAELIRRQAATVAADRRQP
jgi:hypothetical protein